MSDQRIQMGVLLVLMSMLWTGATAQSSCTNAIISLSPCLDYITGNSSTPSSGCCTQLASVVRAQPQCLCEVLNDGGSSLGINVNQTQALALPGACNLQTPLTTLCNADSPTGTPDFPNTGTDNGSSDASSIKLAVPLLFVLIFLASNA